MAEVKLIYCGCTCDSKQNQQGARFQDGKYGPGIRVCNYAIKIKSYVCTVCGKKHGAAGEPSKKAAAEGE